jgi:hypothetical protein
MEHHFLSQEEDKRRNVVKIDHHSISRRPEEPQLQFGEAEYDILMASCSSVYSDRTLLQRLVSSIQVVSYCEERDEPVEKVQDEADAPERKAAAIDIRARHAAITVEEISRKFGVGLETARKTLKGLEHKPAHNLHPLLD